MEFARLHEHRHPRIAALAKTCALVLITAALCALSACTGASNGNASSGEFTPATSITPAEFHADAAEGANGALVDTSCVSDGYVAAKAENGGSARLKLQVICEDASYNYDIPEDGSPAICPLTFGDGTYTFRVMQNTQGNNYIEIYSAQADVALSSEFAPFVRPNIYCNYTESSTCVAKARELVADAKTQSDAVEKICDYIVDNISYDDAKATQLKSASGYVPDPDETLSSGKGICFDYASLGAAMLRSQGIPTKIITGYVSPGNIYHAWLMIYANGSWQTAQFSISANKWSRIDLTFAAAGENQNIGNGKDYTDRYVY